MKFIFGGTTEGRNLVEDCVSRGEPIVVCVASKYGRSLLPQDIICYDHPMEFREMLLVVKRHVPDVLIDATHPFAVRVSDNIRACARKLRIPYQRIERPEGDRSFIDCVRWVENAEDAADLLSREEGAVLLTTGAGMLTAFTDALNPDRLYARVLPTLPSLSHCDAAGVPASHVIAMQGPFSAALNEALYREYGIRHLVTKDSGDVGGVMNKVLPALEMGLDVVIIRRPKEG